MAWQKSRSECAKLAQFMTSLRHQFMVALCLETYNTDEHFSLRKINCHTG